MSKAKTQCALCDLSVEVKGFNLQTSSGEKFFCCEGCLCAYRMFNNDYSPEQLNPKKEEPE
jgi:hypothetical protein